MAIMRPWLFAVFESIGLRAAAMETFSLFLMPLLGSQSAIEIMTMPMPNNVMASKKRKILSARSNAFVTIIGNLSSNDIFGGRVFLECSAKDQRCRCSGALSTRRRLTTVSATLRRTRSTWLILMLWSLVRKWLRLPLRSWSCGFRLELRDGWDHYEANVMLGRSDGDDWPDFGYLKLYFNPDGGFVTEDRFPRYCGQNS